MQHALVVYAHSSCLCVVIIYFLDWSIVILWVHLLPTAWSFKLRVPCLCTPYHVHESN